MPLQIIGVTVVFFRNFIYFLWFQSAYQPMAAAFVAASVSSFKFHAFGDNKSNCFTLSYHCPML